MAKVSKVSTSTPRKKYKPATTPEARENELISLAMDCAEEQLRSGTASSQVITHFLKLGTVKAELDLERTRHENALLKAKTEAIESSKHSEEFYAEVIAALASYQGRE